MLYYMRRQYKDRRFRGSLYDVEYFNQPKEYAKLDYEYVYAVTIRFSEKSIKELESIYGDNN